MSLSPGREASLWRGQRPVLRPFDGRSRPARRGVVARQLTQQHLRIDEAPIQDLFRDREQVLQQRIGNRVSRCRAAPAGDDNPTRAQPRELLRHDRLIDVERPLEVLDAALGRRHQDLEQADANRVGQGPEEFRLEGLQLL